MYKTKSRRSSLGSFVKQTKLNICAWALLSIGIFLAPVYLNAAVTVISIALIVFTAQTAILHIRYATAYLNFFDALNCLEIPLNSDLLASGVCPQNLYRVLVAKCKCVALHEMSISPKVNTFPFKALYNDCPHKSRYNCVIIIANELRFVDREKTFTST